MRLLASIPLLLACGLAGAAERRPNVILIMADDLGYETVAANGGTSYRTPALDRLAATGARFTHCYAQPLCTPTRVQLMTGQSNVRNYIRFGEMDPEAVTFGNLFKQAGYATCIVGKWQLGSGLDLPRKFGFDEHCLWQHTRRPPRYANPGLEINGVEKDYVNGEYGPDLINQYALDFIERKKDAPFFLYYPMILTHAPYQPTPDSRTWDPKAKGEEVNRRPEHFGDMVQYMDKLLGKLMARIEELGLRENTLVVFLGDNGTGRGMRSQMGDRVIVGGKGTTTATGMHVPLIVNWPGKVLPGKVHHDLVDSTDFLPTICEAAGVSVPVGRKLDGRSFLPQLLGQSGTPREWIYSWYSPRQGNDRSVREFAFNQRYKLYRDGRFFALTSDAEENHPLESAALTGAAASSARMLQAALGHFNDARPRLAAADQPPSVILIVADDMGYADMSCQGARGFKTPNLDRMAAEGTRFTSFYVAQAVCTASRAALLTGCYPNRVGLQGALNHTSRNGIHEDEWLLPEMFKERGYVTAGMGKWHLGTRAKFHPLRNGFDQWLGVPYSNDNSKHHPVLAAEMPPLPFYDGEKIIEHDPDQSQFTKRFTQRAVEFIERNAARPFFLYLPHVMPHVPIFASEKFKSRSGAGLYGDVMEELDWSVGEILGTLRRRNIDERTLVIFISDNGPFLSYGEHAGSAAPLREGKLTAFEGGVRVPCVVRWPGRVPAGRVSSDPFVALDWVPTLTEIAGGKPPSKKTDGRSVRGLLLGEANARPPHDALFFYSGTELHAVRSGPWKLHFPHPYLTVAGEPGRGGKPSNWGKLAPKSITQSGVEGIASRHGYRFEQLELSLFNLEADAGETRNLAAEHPDIVRRLSSLAQGIRRELGDTLQKAIGSEVREAGFDAGE